MAAPLPNHAISFRRLMALREIDSNTYTSTVCSWPPGLRAFGGHVYAQAAYAASRTIPPGFYIHNVTGHFILVGRTDIPFTYRVRRIRDGGSYCLRTVEVYQDEPAGFYGSSQRDNDPRKTPCFISTISFKRAEKPRPSQHNSSPSPSHQTLPPTHLQSTYSSVLPGGNNHDPQSHPLSSVGDGVRWPELEKLGYDRWDELARNFPGVEIRKVDMRRYHREVMGTDGLDGERPGAYRQLCFYRIIVDDEDDRNSNNEVDLNLHLCAHLYASDRNSLFLVQRALGHTLSQTQGASLSHTVVFHGSAARLNMLDANSKEPKWFVQEASTSWSGDGRCGHESLLWDWDGDGDDESGNKGAIVVASTMQDGMMRILGTDQGRRGGMSSL